MRLIIKININPLKLLQIPTTEAYAESNSLTAAKGVKLDSAKGRKMGLSLPSPLVFQFLAKCVAKESQVWGGGEIAGKFHSSPLGGKMQFEMWGALLGRWGILLIYLFSSG